MAQFSENPIFFNMFWKYNSNLSSPQIEAVLYKEDVTLQELMDEEEIINECKLQNKKLIDFLVKPEIMEELVTLTTVEPSNDLDAQIRFKYPNIACELLTCDVPTLNERLAGDEALLSKLYSFIDNEPPLNPLLASFFSKIMGVLIAKRNEQVLDFLKAKDNFISLLLKHLDTSAIMDLTLKLMTQVEGVEMRQNILNWLDSQRIIQNLVGLLDAKVDSERHFNVAQLLCDFIKTARETLRNGNITERFDPLLNNIESPETITLLLGHILGDEKCESSIVGGIQILLTLLEINKTSIPNYDSVNQYSNSNSYDEVSDQEQRQAVIQNVTGAILIRLKDFHNILLEPPKKPQVRTTVGVLDPPLGNTRLQVCRLLACLFAAGNPDFMKEIMSLGTINVLLDLFFKYNWNNFLHLQVEQCIASAFVAHIPSDREGENALYTHLIVNCRLIERLLEAWNSNELQQSSKGLRQGYMGSLINIANNIVKLCTSSALGEFIKENVSSETHEAWQVFIDDALKETNKTQQILLAGVHPTNINEDSDEYREIPYAQASITQQEVYTEFQIQQMSPAVIETFDYNNGEFGDNDDPLPTLNRGPTMNFDVSEDELTQQHDIFNQICSQNISTLDSDDENAEDIFQARGQFPFHSVGGDKPREQYSSDSDEEGEDNSPAEDPLMDIDPWASSPIRGVNRSTNPKNDIIPPLSADDPWSSPVAFETTASDTPSWADFSGASIDDMYTQFWASVITEEEHKVEGAALTPPKNAGLPETANVQSTTAVTEPASDTAPGPASATPEETATQLKAVESRETTAMAVDEKHASQADATENLAQKVDALKKEIEIMKQDGAATPKGDEATTAAEKSAPAPPETESAQPSISSSPPSTEGESVPQASV